MTDQQEMDQQELSEVYIRVSLEAAASAGFAVLPAPLHAKRADLLERVRLAWELHRRDFALDQVTAQLREVADEAEKLTLVAPLAEALIAMADIRHHAGDWTGAWELGRRAMACAERMGDTDALVRAQLEVALAMSRLGQEPDKELRQAAAHLDGLAPGTAALVKYIHAKIADERSDLERTRVLLTEALGLADAAQERRLLCRVHIRLGYLDRLAGDLDSAEEHSAAGLEIAEDCGFRRLQAYGLLDLGMVSLKRGEDDKAFVHLLGALRLFSDIGHVTGTAHASSALSAQMRLRGELDEAEVLQRCALAVYIQSRNVCGQALAHRRLGQILRDDGRYDEGQGHLESAIELYRQLESLDGEALSLAALAKLMRARFKPARALPLALEAIDKLGEMSGRFCQGSGRAQFSRLHSWCYSFAFLCAAESEDAAAALRVAAAVVADREGKRAREELLGSDDAELRHIGRQIVSCELSLLGSADEPIGHPATHAEALRLTLHRLFEQLQDANANIADSFRREVVGPTPLPPGTGHHRLTIYGYEEVVPPRLERGVIVVWEGPETSTVSKTALSPAEWKRFAELRRDGDEGERALSAWSVAERARFAELLLPDDLKNAILAAEVRCLQVAGDCRAFPLGACLIGGLRVDAMAVVAEVPVVPSQS